VDGLLLLRFPMANKLIIRETQDGKYAYPVSVQAYLFLVPRRCGFGPAKNNGYVTCQWQSFGIKPPEVVSGKSDFVLGARKVLSKGVPGNYLLYTPPPQRVLYLKKDFFSPNAFSPVSAGLWRPVVVQIFRSAFVTPIVVIPFQGGRSSTDY
jgi:hypothetical protein